VDIKDLTNLIDYLLSDDMTLLSEANADINRDSQVTIKDLTAIIDLLLVL
jgi:hypothetical protein